MDLAFICALLNRAMPADKLRDKETFCTSLTHVDTCIHMSVRVQAGMIQSMQSDSTEEFYCVEIGKKNSAI